MSDSITQSDGGGREATQKLLEERRAAQLREQEELQTRFAKIQSAPLTIPQVDTAVSIALRGTAWGNDLAGLRLAECSIERNEEGGAISYTIVHHEYRVIPDPLAADKGYHTPAPPTRKLGAYMIAPDHDGRAKHWLTWYEQGSYAHGTYLRAWGAIVGELERAIKNQAATPQGTAVPSPEQQPQGTVIPSPGQPDDRTWATPVGLYKTPDPGKIRVSLAHTTGGIEPGIYEVDPEIAAVMKSSDAISEALTGMMKYTAAPSPGQPPQNTAVLDDWDGEWGRMLAEIKSRPYSLKEIDTAVIFALRSLPKDRFTIEPLRNDQVISYTIREIGGNLWGEYTIAQGNSGVGHGFLCPDLSFWRAVNQTVIGQLWDMPASGKATAVPSPEQPGVNIELLASLFPQEDADTLEELFTIYDLWEVKRLNWERQIIAQITFSESTAKRRRRMLKEKGLIKRGRARK